MFQEGELESIGASTGLVILNVVLMAAIAFSPLNQFTGFIFGVAPIIGVIVFGAMITGGVVLAKKGIRQDNFNRAILGTGVLQFAYAVFGGGILSVLPPRLMPVVLAVTAVITGLMALLSGLLVYGTAHNFSRWRSYSNYMFLGVLLFALLGSFSRPVTVVAFFLALGGFLAYLVYEIWEMKQKPGKVYMNAIGIYVAFMGVFVQILQLVIEMYLEE